MHLIKRICDTFQQFNINTLYPTITSLIFGLTESESSSFFQGTLNIKGKIQPTAF